MEEFIKMLSEQDSGFSVTRKNRVIRLTMGEAADCLFHYLDMMGGHALTEAYLLNGRQLSDEQVLTLREEITISIIRMIEEKMKLMAFNLFQE